MDIGAGAVQDIAGNDNTAADRLSIEYDGSAPGTAVSAVQPGPTNAATINFHVNFTAPVAGFTSGDIRLTGEAAPAGGVAGFAPGDATGANYTFDVVPTQDGTLTVDIAAGVAQGTANGLDNTASPTFKIRSDRTAPTPIINSTQPGPVTADTPVTFHVNFTEAVPGFAASDVELSGAGADGATVDSFANDGKDIVYTFEVAPTADGPVNVDVAAGVAADLAGNENLAALRYSIQYDSSVPGTTITSEQTGPTNTTPIVFNVTFSRDVTGFAGTDVILTGDPVPTSGGLADFKRINATNYSFKVAPVQDGTITVNVAGGVAQSTANGLDNTAATPLAIRYDGSAPAPGITGGQTLSHGAPTLNFTVDWGERVTGFDTADVVLSGITTTGGVLNLKVAPGTDDKNYTFGVIPTQDGTLYVDIAAGTVQDIAGNDNTAADRFSIVHDSAAPRFIHAFVSGNYSITAVYTEPVLSDGAHYTDIRNGTYPLASGALDAKAFGNSVLVSWTADTAITGPDQTPSISFVIDAAVADKAGNGLANPGLHNTALDGSGTFDLRAFLSDGAAVDRRRVDIPIFDDSPIRTINAADITPVIWFNRTDGGSGTFQSHLTVSHDRATVVFPARHHRERARRHVRDPHRHDHQDALA